MIIAGVGGKKEVRDRRIAIPEVGPIPGRTPISVPIKTPIKQYSKFVAEKATWYPIERFSKNPVI